MISVLRSPHNIVVCHVQLCDECLKSSVLLESLFDVAYRLAGHQSSLASLARVAQKYRPIAEEVLYDAPNQPDVFSNVSSARLFLQALLVKPDAVPRVKKLALPVVKQHSAHSKDCIAPDRCVCVWPDSSHQRS
jgi:hypothetical protein